ncbi:MAG: hypothetical protein JO149_04030 [Gammaproteobacteria bacterium]|nr:hypothetical protein [Gammaproteobacteria bacterium]
MITRFTQLNRYPGGKILGFGATPKMQKRHFMNENDVIIAFGIYTGLVSVATLGIYFSCRYLYNNYKIVRKDKQNEANISAEPPCVKRPGRS